MLLTWEKERERDSVRLMWGRGNEGIVERGQRREEQGERHTEASWGGGWPWKSERDREGRRTRPPNVKYLTGDDKSNGNYCGKNIIRNLIEVKQNLHNTAN